MRRARLLILLLLAVCALRAHDLGTEHTSVNTWSVGAGGLSVADPQLSASVYRGFSVTVSGMHAGDYKAENADWTVTDRLTYGRLLNESHTAAMHHIRGKFSFASCYRAMYSHFVLRAGGSLRTSGALDYLPRNYNNEVSADIRLQACGYLRLNLNYGKFQMVYALEFPMIGCAFAPDYGQSYYEVWQSMPGLGSAARFASVHNCWEADGRLSFYYIGNSFGVAVSFVHDNSLFIPTWKVPEYRFWHNDLSGELSFSVNLGRLETRSRAGDSTVYF